MDQPNVILLTWHDAGDWFGHTGRAGVPWGVTPGVDRLAAEGVRFTRCFSASAICSPSRAAMLTGRYCQANGVMGLTNTVFDNRIVPGLTHLSRRFRAAGYHTSLVGVQHECAKEHVAGVIGPDVMRATEPWMEGHRLADEVGAWLEERAGDFRGGGGRPFFGQIGTYDAHLGRFLSGKPAVEGEAYPVVLDGSPGVEVPGWLSGSDADRACLAALRGSLRRGDAVVSRLLETLDRTGLARDTLVIMAVDHGPGLARAKGTCYDDGTRVSWLLRRPGALPAGRVIDALATHVDLVPTLAGLLGWSIDEPLDGRDFSAHVRGEADYALNDAVYSHMMEGQRSVRTDRHRLIRNFRPPRSPVGQPGDCAQRHACFDDPHPTPNWRTCEPSAAYPLVELYDLDADPDQMRNLAPDPAHATQLRDLDRRLFEFLSRQDDFILHESIESPWQASMRRDVAAHLHGTGRGETFDASI